jgi:hypothetical protein
MAVTGEIVLIGAKTELPHDRAYSFFIFFFAIIAERV